MSLKIFEGEKFSFPMFENKPDEPPAIAKVVGIGGAGLRVAERLCKTQMPGVECIAMDTDAHTLQMCACPCKVQLGKMDGFYESQSAKANCARAAESIAAVRSVLQGAHIVVLVAGLGGGTGTGASPVVAQAALEMGALVVCMAIKPFPFEGKKRMETAKQGLAALLGTADTVLVFENKQLVSFGSGKSTFAAILEQADELLCQRLKQMLGFINHTGYISLDFRDIHSVLKKAGLGRLTFAAADGEGDTRKAVEEIACNTRLLKSVQGAQRILVNFEFPPDISIELLEQVCLSLNKAAPADADFLWGVSFCEDFSAETRVTILATGINTQDYLRQAEPEPPILKEGRHG